MGPLESMTVIVINVSSDAVTTLSALPERCSDCDRPMFEPDGTRHVCFFFLE